jgi:hypothetical protein
MRSNPAHKNEPKRLAAHDGKNGIDRSSEKFDVGTRRGCKTCAEQGACLRRRQFCGSAI